MSSVYLSLIIVVVLIFSIYIVATNSRMSGKYKALSEKILRDRESIKRFNDEMRKPVTRGKDLVRDIRARSRRLRDK